MNPEAELAKHIVTYFKSLGYTVYQEVQIPYGPRADLVAVKDHRITAVEVKMHPNEKVILQAHYWNPFAHAIYVAIPRQKKTNLEFLKRCSDLNIGVIEVNGSEVMITTKPLEKSHIFAKLQLALHPLQQHWAPAGNNQSKRYSKFQFTVQQLRDLAKNTPGIPLQEALGKIKHHYKNKSSAYYSLLKWLKHGKIKGMRVSFEQGAWRVYVK